MHLRALLLSSSLFLVGAPLPHSADPPKKEDGFKREGKDERRKTLDAMEGKAPPPVDVGTWVKGGPVKIEDLKGKVVLLDFWGNW